MNDYEIEEMLLDHEKRMTALESSLSMNKEKLEMVGFEQPNISVLSRKIDIPKDKLMELFDFEDKQLTVLNTAGGSIKEKTQNMSLIVLLGYQYIFGVKDVLSQEIRRNVAENSISIDNFGTHLNDLSPSLIRRIGKVRSSKTKYRLTTLGEVKAREKVKQILSV